MVSNLKNRSGFTLIELMIVVAIIGVLASIAIPKFANLITKSKEAAVQGQLGALRSALNIYYSDNEGVYPTDGTIALTPKYIASITYLTTPVVLDQGNPGHIAFIANIQNICGATTGLGAVFTDSGGVVNMQGTTFIGATQYSCGFYSGGGGIPWVYVAMGAPAGQLYVPCLHYTTSGIQWSTF